MGQDDAVDIVLDFKANQSSLSELRDEIASVMERATKLANSEGFDNIFDKMNKDVLALDNEIAGLEVDLEKIGGKSVQIDFEKTIKQIIEVERRLEEIVNFRTSSVGYNDALSQQIDSAKSKLDELSTKLTEATSKYDELKNSSAESLGKSEEKYAKELSASEELISKINLEIEAQKRLISAYQEGIQANNTRVEAEKQEESQLTNRLSSLQAESDELEKILESDELLAQEEEKRVATHDAIKNKIMSQTQELRKQLGEVIRIVQEEEKRQSNQSGTLNGQSQLSKEEEASLKNRRSYIKSLTAQYYYQLRALKMLDNILGGVDKTTDKWGKSLLNASVKALKVFGKLSLGFLGLKRNMDKATKSSNSFGASLLKNLWTTLRYILGIRSIYSLFTKLRSALSDGMQNLAMASSHVNKQMSSVVSSLLQMKNAAATVVQPLLNVLAPALEKIATICSKVAYAIASVIAALTGQKVVYKASKAVESYIDAQKGAKKATEDTTDAMKQQLASFDKLNLLTTDKDKDSDSGGGGGMNPADMFDTVPLEEKWKNFADKIKRILTDLFAPIKRAWQDEGQFVIDSWKYGLNECWKLIKDIGRDFLIMWNQEATVNMWRDIFHIIGDIGLIIGHLAENLRTAWNTNHIGLKIFEDIRDILAIIIHGIREAADYTVEWASRLNFYPLLKSIHGLLEKMKGLVQTIVDLGVYFYENVILKFQKYLIEQGLPNLLDTIGEIIDRIDQAKLSERMKKLMDAFEPFLEKVWEALVIVLKDLGDAVVNFINSDAFGKFVDTLVKWMKKANPQKMAKGIEALVKNFIQFKAAIKIGKTFSKVFIGLKTVFNFLLQSSLRRELMSINSILTNMGGEATAAVSGYAKLNTSIVSFVNSLKAGGQSLADFILDIGAGKVSLKEFSNVMSGALKGIQDTIGVVGRAIAGIGGFIVEWKLVTSGVKDFILESDNLGNSFKNIGKIVGGLTVGIVGLVIAFGPFGAVVGIIAGIVAALWGMHTALNEINKQEVGNAIRKVYTDNDGVPVTEYIDKTADSIREIGDSFSEMSSKSNDLEGSRVHIKNVASEISTIKTAMDNGVISVEEGKQKLEEAFEELTTNTQAYFLTMTSLIEESYGPDGLLRKTMEEMGVDVSAGVDMTLQALSGLSEEAYNTAKEMSELDPNSEEWENCRQKLMELTGQTDLTTEAVENLANYIATNKLDLSEFITEDGEMDVQALHDKLVELNIAVESTVDTVEGAVGDLSKSETNLASTAQKYGVIGERTSDGIKQFARDTEGAKDILVGNIRNMGGESVTQMQYWFRDQLPEVIREASDEWDRRANSDKWTDKLYTHFYPKERYLKSVVDQWGESAKTMSTEIGEVMGQEWEVPQESIDQIVDGTNDVILKSWHDYYNTGKSSATADEIAAMAESMINDAMGRVDAEGSGEALASSNIDGQVKGLTAGASRITEATGPINDAYDEMANSTESAKDRAVAASKETSEAIGTASTKSSKEVKTSSDKVKTSAGEAAKASEDAGSKIQKSSGETSKTVKEKNGEIKTSMEKTATAAKTNGEGVSEGYFGGIKTTWNNLVGGILGLFKGMNTSVHDDILDEGSPSRVYEGMGNNVIFGFSNGTHDTWSTEESGILGIFSGMRDDAQEEVSEEKFKGFGSDVIKGFKEGLENKWNEVKDKVGGLWTSISEGARNAFKIGSPSKVFREIGSYIIEGLEIGLSDNDIEDSFIDMASDLSKNTLDIFNELIDNINELMSRMELLTNVDSISTKLSKLSNIKIPDIALGMRLPDNMSFNNDSIEELRDKIEEMSNSQYEEIELLRSQNQLLTAILEKEFSISSKQVFDQMRRENRNYIRRNGESAFAY